MGYSVLKIVLEEEGRVIQGEGRIQKVPIHIHQLIARDTQFLPKIQEKLT